VWVTWWLGDLCGAVIVAPVVLLWSAEPRLRWNRRQASEAVVVLLMLVAGGLAVFGGLVRPNPLIFLALPLLLWPAFRFGPRETASAGPAARGNCRCRDPARLRPLRPGVPERVPPSAPVVHGGQRGDGRRGGGGGQGAEAPGVFACAFGGPRFPHRRAHPAALPGRVGLSRWPIPSAMARRARFCSSTWTTSSP
jgi:hypothetical protein